MTTTRSRFSISTAPPVLLVGLLAGLATTSCTAPSAGSRIAGPTFADPTLAAQPAFPKKRPSRAGFTGSLIGGAGFLLDTNLSSSDAGAPATGDASFDTGWTGGGALGYRFENGWSADLEMTYRSNGVNRIAAPAGNIDEGDFASLSVMANARYHFPVDGPLQPYVGFGAGWVEEIDIDIGAESDENSFSTSGFGLQAMVGAEFALSDRLSLGLEGRYFRAFAEDYESEAGPAIRYDADYDRLEALLSLTWRF